MLNKSFLPPLTQKITDESTIKEFIFTFYCDHCGTGYQTPPIPFTGAIKDGDLKHLTKTQKLIWEAEHEDAYERANQRALLIFTPCAQCGKMICEDCQDELAKVTLCPTCRNNKKISGERKNAAGRRN